MRAIGALCRSRCDSQAFSPDCSCCFLLAADISAYPSQRLSARPISDLRFKQPSKYYAARLASPKRPPHPAPNVRDDRETPLLIEAGRPESVPLICPTAQAQYFCEGDWTTQISLNRLSKSPFTRRRIVASRDPREATPEKKSN